MRVLYEGAIFQMLRQGGVARCFSELIQHLPSNCTPVLAGPAEDPPMVERSGFEFVGFQTEPAISWLRKWKRESMQRSIAAGFDSTQADVEHWTYYNGLCRRPLVRSSRPLVVTILDFVHEAFPSLDPSGKHIELKRRAIELADHLICISHSTFHELIKRHPAASSKASVIPLGTSLQDVQPSPLPKQLCGRPYVLFVGRRNSYKNFSLVWHAWNRIQASLPNDACLAVAGPPVKRRERNELEWDESKKVVSLPNVNDSVLRALYQHAKAFVFPSRAEGFGLPSLEAMACRTPVLISDLPVMREVAGDAGYYFGVDELSHLADLFAAAIENRLPAVEDVTGRGVERAKRFCWQTTAAKTAEVYQNVIRSSRNDAASESDGGRQTHSSTRRMHAA
ncbi:MAG: glycosyltransferase family 1 protein [Planctomycetota bacterium]